MRMFRVLVAGFFLFAANLVGILAGFLVYRAVRPVNQLTIQAPVAAASSLILYLAWTLALRGRTLSRFRLRSTADNAWAFVASLAWGPVVFMPLHCATQGYIADPGNLMALAVSQAPVNAAVLVAAVLLERRDERDTTRQRNEEPGMQGRKSEQASDSLQ